MFFNILMAKNNIFPFSVCFSKENLYICIRHLNIFAVMVII